MRKTMLSTASGVCLVLLATTGSSNETSGLPHAFEAGWKGQKTCEMLFEDETVRIGRCIFPPGVGHEKHYHNPHYGYVLEGSTLRLRDKNGVRDAKTITGSSWSTDAITVHEALNVGDVTTSYLIVEPISR